MAARIEVALVADEDDGDFLIGVVAHLLQPLVDGLERDAAADVVDEQHADRLPVVGVSHGAVPLLPSSVPNLRANGLVLDPHVVRRELHPDCGVRVPIELVLRVSVEELGLADLGVPDEHELKHIVVLGPDLLLAEELVLPRAA